MRIIAGEFKGRAVESPSEKTTRPTTDRVRESMFSAIYSRVPDFAGMHVLDAFAGSGALGIEALSRGAETATFYERDAKARRVLEANLSSLGLGRSRATVRASDVFQAAKRPLAPSGGFGLVMLDPPYATDSATVEQLLAALVENGDFAPGALVVYEHAHGDSGEVSSRFSENKSFVLDAVKKYGKIGVAYLVYRH